MLEIATLDRQCRSRVPVVPSLLQLGLACERRDLAVLVSQSHYKRNGDIEAR
jgi:hypothetical protein